VVAILVSVNAVNVPNKCHFHELDLQGLLYLLWFVYECSCEVDHLGQFIFIVTQGEDE
jgi:hypothetical protein